MERRKKKQQRAATSSSELGRERLQGDYFDLAELQTTTKSWRKILKIKLATSELFISFIFFGHKNNPWKIRRKTYFPDIQMAHEIRQNNVNITLCKHKLHKKE